LFVLRRNSSFSTIGLEPIEALAKRDALAADDALESRVAVDSVDPAVEPVAQVAGPACVSAVDQPSKSTFRSSAKSSPFVSFRKIVSGGW
jgi:hypothetical protein